MLYQKLIENHLGQNKCILSDGKNCLTYEQIHDTVKHIARHLKNQGLQKGDRVLIINHNSLETALLVLGCLAEGYVFVLAHEDDSELELENLRQDCDARCIIDKPGIFFYPDISHWTRTLCNANDCCYILYTSGSSGKSKGIVACQKQVSFCIEAILERLQYGPEDRVMCCLPLAFDYGLYQLFLSLKSEAQLFLAPTNHIQRVTVWLLSHRITIFPAMATIINLLFTSRILNQENLRFLRMITFTGEELPLQLLEKLKKLCPNILLIPMYGLSECKRVSILPLNREDKMWAGSCGIPLDHVRVYLENKNPETGIGELIVEGPNVMEGYWKDPEETAKVFGFDTFTGCRYVRTGDLFRIDEEGFLFFCGRKSRMIKTMGYRFFPQELEKRVSQVKGITECRVVGIPHQVYGEQICICIYPENQEIFPEVAEAADFLPLYLKTYRIWLWNQPLPKNKNGKIDDKEIRRTAIYDTSFPGG